MNEGGNKIVFKKEDIWLIPNIITYFRMLCIPAFVVLCLVGGLREGSDNLIFWALGVFMVAAASDLVDGKIARKYNMISDIGKVFDPLADKLMHVSVIICLTIISYLPWYFIAVIALKELMMICLSPVLLKRKIVIQAVFAGKIASAVLSFGVIAAFFHPQLVDVWSFGKSFGVEMSFDWIFLAVGCVLSLYAAGTYLCLMVKALKQFNVDFANGLVDANGNRLNKEEGPID
jgi:Phosphatidylglycerophosphate synthase